MSTLKRLIQQHCPNGVPFYELGELGKFYGGITGKSKDDFTNGNAKFITYKNVYANPALKIDVDDRVKIAPDEKQRTLEYGDVIFTGSSETPNECGISSVLTEKTEEKLYLNSFCFLFRFNDLSLILPDLAKHLFRSTNLRHQIGKTASGVTRYNVSKKLMEKVVIPVPPIEVQREIVRILDNFTELTAELTARKKQYEYYRDDLLSLPDVPRLPLSQLTLKVGSINWKTTDGTRKYIDLSSVNRDTHSIIDADILEVSADNAPSRAKQLVQENDILFGGTRPMLKRYCIVPAEYDKQVCSTGYCVLRVDAKKALTSYVYHCLGTSEFYRYVEANQQGASYPAISDKVLKDYTIPVPTLEMQKKIATVLDRFNVLCNDLSAGLPAEIAARQKQYEYYRDKLLTFQAA